MPDSVPLPVKHFKGSFTMMDLCKMRMKKMMSQKKQDGMMCPMCMKMMREKMGLKDSNNR
jgi:hypothetical protein